MSGEIGEPHVLAFDARLREMFCDLRIDQCVERLLDRDLVEAGKRREDVEVLEPESPEGSESTSDGTRIRPEVEEAVDDSGWRPQRRRCVVGAEPAPSVLDDETPGGLHRAHPFLDIEGVAPGRFPKGADQLLVARGPRRRASARTSST